MKRTHSKKRLIVSAIIVWVGSLFIGACANMTPLDNSSLNTPSKQLTDMNDVKVTYNYSDTGPVQLSSNNVVVNKGQRLVLEPAPGLTQSTRFTSSGEDFFGDIMQQGDSQLDGGRVTFVATNPGKRKLQIIPNHTELDRAVDLWVTVQ